MCLPCFCFYSFKQDTPFITKLYIQNIKKIKKKIMLVVVVVAFKENKNSVSQLTI